MRTKIFDIQRFASITNSTSNTVINGTDSVDSLINEYTGNNVTVNMGNGENTVINHGVNVEIYGAYGNDSIYNVGYNVLVSGNSGSDTIKSRGFNVTLYGGEGSDLIETKDAKVAVCGGTEDDVILISGSSDVTYKYADGDGNDIIYGIGNKDQRIEITSGNIRGATVSGEDVILYVGEGSITLNSSAGNLLNIVDSDGTLTQTVIGTDAADTDTRTIIHKIYNYEDNTITGPFADNTVFYNYGSNVTVNSDFSGTKEMPETIYSNAFGKEYFYWNYGLVKDKCYKIIYNFTEIDEMEILLYSSKNLYSTFKRNDDLIISIDGDEHITLVGAANISASVNFVTLRDIEENLHNGSLTGTEGADKLHNYAENAVIKGLTGNDHINNENYIYYRDSNIGDNIARNGGNGSTIFAGNGDDTVWNSSDNVLIDGGDGNDDIDNSCYKYDYITVAGNSERVTLSSGDNVTINAGLGDDIITNGDVTDGTLLNYTTEGGQNVVIDGGDGNDTINSHNKYFKEIKGGSGNDYIYHDREIYYQNSVIDGEDGDDSISSGGGKGIINGGNGNDSIDVDNIFDYSDLFTINGGSGNDYINSSNCMINGDEGNDFIVVEYSLLDIPATIKGGVGNDLIYNDIRNWYEDYQWIGKSANIYEYTTGDGNDTIYNFGDSDTLNIGTTYTKTTAGNNIIIGVGNESITLVDAINPSSLNIIGTLISENTVTTSLEKSYENTYFYTGGNQKIENYSSNEIINFSDDYTGMNVEGDNFIVKSSTGALMLENVRDKIIDIRWVKYGHTGIYVYMAGKEGFIDGTLSDRYEIIVCSENAPNHIKAGNGGSSLIGGGGDNTLTGGDEHDSFVYKAGNDVITNYQSGEILNFVASYTGWTTENNDLIINAVEGSVLINEAKNKLLELADGGGNLIAHVFLATGYEGALDGRRFSEFEVISGSDNLSNQIYAGSGGSSLYGGVGGNDELYGNSGYDEFVYKYGDGQDNFYNIGAEDAVNLNGIILEQISSVEFTDIGLIAKFTDGGALNINGQAGTFIVGGQRFGADYQSKSFYAN